MPVTGRLLAPLSRGRSQTCCRRGKKKAGSGLGGVSGTVGHLLVFDSRRPLTPSRARNGMCFGGSWLQDTQAHCKGVVCFPFPHLPGAGPPPPRGHLRRTHDRLLQEGPAAAELASPGPIVHLRANDVEKQQVHGHSRAGLSSSACCRHIPDMLRLPRLPQLPGRITFLAPRLTHSAAPRKPTGLCQALYMHHDTASSGPTTFVADRRRRHPERLSNSPSVAQLWDATLRREMGTPACRMWAEAFGNHSLPTWLSELLSRAPFLAIPLQELSKQHRGRRGLGHPGSPSQHFQVSHQNTAQNNK
ncbi:uncharacterized protein LOC119873290 isoform X2 [Canis lupus familiaris]|uniref:uncharacterized protein LOC119873290 isoform X2 n=1 Tax=Canis lupus familiaris TaxID=9615 RepID=UPI0018F7D297|nr:uncharacterized protein LOC119873290 isoform X2 [Canis lupus familiaris]